MKQTNIFNINEDNGNTSKRRREQFNIDTDFKPISINRKRRRIHGSIRLLSVTDSYIDEYDIIHYNNNPKENDMVLPLLPVDMLKEIVNHVDQNTILSFRATSKVIGYYLFIYWTSINILNVALITYGLANNIGTFTRFDNNMLYIFEDVKQIDLSSQYNITDEGLTYLSGLHTIYLRWCKQITDIGLSNLSDVHTIDLSFCYYITDNGLQYLSGVNSIKLSGCWRITDKTLKYLSNVNNIYLDRCYQITDNGLSYLSDVHTINLTGCRRITNEGLKYLSNDINIII